MTIEQFKKDESLHDDRYHFYRPTIPLRMFCSEIEADTIDEYSIGIAKEYDLEQMLPVINDYLEWMKNCKDEVTAYFQKRLGDHVPEGWFESIGGCNFSLIVDDFDNYGATVSFGESIFSDHTIELDFERRQIVDNRLNG